MPDEPVLHESDRKFFSELHQKHWQNIREYSAASTLFRDDKEFILHLYDKLWENIIHKENRLWTFLTIYGAAIGIVIGTGVTETLRLEAGLVILLLTYWVAELFIDTDWWSVRNRLMVRGIERRVHEATEGIIPSYYNTPRYAGESLHNISLFVFAAIGIIVFALSIGMFETDRNIKSWWELFGITALYGVAAFSLVRCAHNREKRIAEYYSTFEDLNRKEQEAQKVLMPPVSQSVLESSQVNDRKRLSSRPYIFFLYAIMTLMIGSKYYKVVNTFSFTIFCIFQAIVILKLAAQWCRYCRGGKDSHPIVYGFFPISIRLRNGRECTKKNTLLWLTFLVSIAVPLLGTSKFP